VESAGRSESAAAAATAAATPESKKVSGHNSTKAGGPKASRAPTHIEDDDNDVDLEAIQRLEDAALKERDARRESSGSAGAKPPPPGVFSPPTAKKRDSGSFADASQAATQIASPRQKQGNVYTISNTFAAKSQPSPQQAQKAMHPLKGPWWWLEDRHVRDASMRRPDDPEFDPSTVFIPHDAASQFTDFQKQYWEIKRVHFDMLIFAKLGKFYEAYENDAEVAHRRLGLNYTHGGRDPHSKKMLCAGVPENSIEGIVGKLVALGYKVGIVEEMEKASDVKKAQAVSSSARKVVVRSLRKIYTPGTMRDDELLGGGDAKPLVCISVPQHGAAGNEVETLADTILGVCLLDCSTGRFNVGTLPLPQLDVLLRTHRPHEVLHARGRLTGPLKSWLRNSTSTAVWSTLPAGHRDDEFWPADVTRARLAEMFAPHQDDDRMSNEAAGRGGSRTMPKVLADLIGSDSEEAGMALNALGGAIAYLKKLGLASSLLSLDKFDDLHGLGDDGPKCMLLDIQTLNGLDVLEQKGTERQGTDSEKYSI